MSDAVAEAIQSSSTRLDAIEWIALARLGKFNDALSDAPTSILCEAIGFP
jgi:hypothetical protein